jgi:putative ABC transport system ATP-binding protein
MLRTEHLTRAVQGKLLVNDVSVTVEKSDVIAVIGPSGAGKSSFLRLLNRLDEPTGGTVYLDGQDYRNIPPQELRRRVGMLMQTPFLFPGTVADNIRFGPLQRGELLPDATIEELLDRVHLPDYAARSIDNLSGGEAQRVSLARTLANRPEILLLDEPTSALDGGTEREVEGLIADIIREQKLTCLLVTHKIEQAQRLANRAMVMTAGRLIAFGPIREVLDAHPAL